MTVARAYGPAHAAATPRQQMSELRHNPSALRRICGRARASASATLASHEKRTSRSDRSDPIGPITRNRSHEERPPRTQCRTAIIRAAAHHVCRPGAAAGPDRRPARLIPPTELDRRDRPWTSTCPPISTNCTTQPPTTGAIFRHRPRRTSARHRPVTTCARLLSIRRTLASIRSGA